MNGRLAWLKWFVPYVVLALGFAMWCGRLEARVDSGETLQTRGDATTEYIRRQNERILTELERVKADTEWIRERLRIRGMGRDR